MKNKINWSVVRTILAILVILSVFIGVISYINSWPSEQQEQIYNKRKTMGMP